MNQTPPKNPEDRLQMVLVVRKDLRMRRGKEISQAGHGVQGCLTDGATVEEDDAGRYLRLPLTRDMEDWLTNLSTKITVTVNSESELLTLHEKVQAAGLRSCLVKDHGVTEFAGVHTYTALVIGPHLKSVLDQFTGELPIY